MVLDALRAWCRPAATSRSMASGSRPRSASDPASTMRPSVTSAAPGDTSASSRQSSSTRSWSRRARAQSISTGCWSTSPVIVDVRLELLGRGGVLAGPVERQAEELAHRRRARHRLHERPQHAHGVALAPLVVGLATPRPSPGSDGRRVRRRGAGSRRAPTPGRAAVAGPSSARCRRRVPPPPLPLAAGPGLPRTTRNDERSLGALGRRASTCRGTPAPRARDACGARCRSCRPARGPTRRHADRPASPTPNAPVASPNPNEPAACPDPDRAGGFPDPVAPAACPTACAPARAPDVARRTAPTRTRGRLARTAGRAGRGFARTAASGLGAAARRRLAGRRGRDGFPELLRAEVGLPDPARADDGFPDPARAAPGCPVDPDRGAGLPGTAASGGRLARSLARRAGLGRPGPGRARLAAARLTRRTGRPGRVHATDLHRNADSSHHHHERRNGHKKKAGRRTIRLPAVSKKSGGDLLSQGAPPQVPSARAVFTSVFGMGTGVTPPL